MTRWRERRTHPRMLFGLLGLSVLLAAVLAVVAQRALRGQRETAERALRGEAAFAAFSLASQTGRDLYWGIIDLFAPVTGFDFSNRRDPRAPLDAIRRDPCEYRFTCVIRDSADFWFRIGVADGSLAVSGAPHASPLPAPVREELRAALTGVLASRATGRPDRPYAHTAVTLDGKRRVVVAVPLELPRGEVVAYGFAIDPALYGRMVLPNSFTRGPLLPAFLTSGVASESLYTYRLTDRGGQLLVESGDAASASYATELPVDSTGGDLRIRLALGRGLVAHRLAGALPPMRLATVGMLFALNAVLIVLVIARLRGEFALARRRAAFTAGVSHELRTPLTQILLYAESLHGGTLRAERDRRHAGEVIVREATRLLTMVDNVLRHVRSERGAPATHALRVELSAAETVREVAATMAPFARERRAGIVERIDGPAMVRVDAVMLRQAVVNLLDNALKYGPAGDDVTIGCRADGALVRVWVDSGGRSLTPRERELVWEPFVRLDQGPDAPAATGTGLGLSVVRYAAELLGGRACAEPLAGGGNRFVLELPALTAHSPPPRSAAAKAAPRRDRSLT